MTNYFPPEYQADAFSCPLCGVYSRQTFYGAMRESEGGTYSPGVTELPGFDVSCCDKCEELALWHNGALIYPPASTALLPHADMPEDVTADYQEARKVADASPRSAAALLRLALQKLCKHLGEPGENINTDIGSLVKKGLDANLQKTLDVLRITGNNAVHPGELDVRDDRELTGKLFALLNLIVQQMITQPRAIQELWEQMPQGARDAVARRDAEK